MADVIVNFAKCKYLHIRHWKLDVNYKIGDTILGTSIKENDLGITTIADMKVSEQYGIAASKANPIIWLIRINLTYKEKS